MDHFYQNIYGWFDFQQVYKEAVERAKDGSHFVEVGCWNGRSTAYMAVEIINSGKMIEFDCIDNWEGDQGTKKYHLDPNKAFEEFKNNIKPVSHIVNYYKLASVEASKKYEKESLDFVFIDAAHDYYSVYADIGAWHPLVKKGCILAGHDYQSQDIKNALNNLGFKDKVEIIGTSWVMKV